MRYVLVHFYANTDNINIEHEDIDEKVILPYEDGEYAQLTCTTMVAVDLDNLDENVQAAWEWSIKEDCCREAILDAFYEVVDETIFEDIDIIDMEEF